MSKQSENVTPETPSPKAVREWTEAADLAKEVTAQAGDSPEKALVIMSRAALDLGLMASAGSRAFLRLKPNE